MVNFSTDKALYKKRISVPLVFWFVTLIMLVTRYASFYSFKGSDDLHYAFLSSHVLNGSYDMFIAQDIYAGRAVVVLYQALWFKLFGINDFTMCMPSLTVLILLAYFVCFKCGLQKNIRTILLAASLIYFNPVVTRATLGNLPDVYIALIALLVFLLIKKNTGPLSIKQNILWGFITALLLLAGLFVKENIVLIYAGTAVLLLYYRKKISRHFVIALATTVFMGSAGYLLFYYINTGDFFYRFVQIKNSAYFNVCSYQCLPYTALLKRLTVTVPLIAALTGAYPLLLSATVLFSYKKQINPDTRFWKITFISLLLLALYFPFSIFPYVPLCHDMRQFFFLFPFATILYVSCLQEEILNEKHTRTINIAGTIVFVPVTLICYFFAPYNKWAILCNGLLALVFMLNIFSIKKIQQFFFYLMIPFILWLSTAYSIYKRPHDGYDELKTLYSKLKQQTNFVTNTYYFLNNDTKTHFALIHQFDTAKRFFNFDTLQNGFKPFAAYQLQPILRQTNSIQNGWLIINDAFPENISSATINSIKELLAAKYFCITINNTRAYYLTSAETAEKIMHLINSNTSGSNCN